MDTIYIKASKTTTEYLEIDLETLLIITVYNISSTTEHPRIKLKILLEENSEDSNPQFRIYLSQLKYEITTPDEVPTIANYCIWPVIVVQKTVVAGLCSVSRQIIKSSGNENVKNLLGFREACLVACSESSIWTKFCEVDVIRCVKDVVRKYNMKHQQSSGNLVEIDCKAFMEMKIEKCDNCNTTKTAVNSETYNFKTVHSGGDCEEGTNNFKTAHSGDCEETNNFKTIHCGDCEKEESNFKTLTCNTILNSLKENVSQTTTNMVETLIIPVDLTRFEYHMQQPVKIHNVYKMAREQNKNKDIKSSVPLKELNIPHCFSEGPQLTLSDVLLHTCVRILVSIYGEGLFEQELPLIYKWDQNIRSLKLINLKYEVVNGATFNFNLKNLHIVHENVVKESLYSSDPNRYKPQSRIYTKQNDIECSVDLITQSGIGVENSGLPYGHEVDFNWLDVPLEVNPEGGSLPKSRSNRKCQQLENLAKAVVKICTDKTYTIVDFCSGSGHLGLLLSVLLPKCEVILVENKERSLIRAKERVEKLKLENVILLQCNLDYFRAKFNIGVSLHACGVATDLVIQNCILNKAHFVSCPCCYGGIHDCYHLTYPRSDSFKNVVTYGNYLHFAHAADQTHEVKNAKTKQGYKCMDIVDTDRKLYAEKFGYEVFLGKLDPVSCTPKNNLIVGVFK